jgi:hypothetical protein
LQPERGQSDLPEPSRSARDVPPVITYPEFLLHSQKPAPLITARRLLYTAYFTGGLVAAFYGLSNFIVTPMTEILTEARHDFATHSHEQLQQMNQRLGQIVSSVPSKTKNPKAEPSDATSEASEDSDPTELYHRDFGTQTSPVISRRPSVAQGEQKAASSDPSAITDTHLKRLEILRSHASEIAEWGSNEDSTCADGRAKVKDLHHYLDTLTYPTLDYSSYGFEGFHSNGNGSSKTKDDAIEAVKKEIRSVKGVLLSARNFPSSHRIARVGAT